MLHRSSYTRPYTQLGTAQHLTVVRDETSEIDFPVEALTLARNLPETVLASAFVSSKPVKKPEKVMSAAARTLLGEPDPLPGRAPQLLPFPNTEGLALPTLSHRDLRPQAAVTATGQRIGTLLNVPALYVTANQILKHQTTAGDWLPYNYLYALHKMLVDAARMFAGVVDWGVLRVRENPGMMAHLVADSRLGWGPGEEWPECGVSLEMARALYGPLRQELHPLLMSVWDLDGLPVYGIRFPLANRWGIQRMRLRILPEPGRYVRMNPWLIGKRLLGDEDGDQAFILPLVDELKHGRETLQRLPALPGLPEPRIFANLGWRDYLDPTRVPVSDKLREKLQPLDFSTRSLRCKAIRDADTRADVAIYTMALGWWQSRILSIHPDAGVAGPAEAHACAFDSAEWSFEACFDARKGKNVFDGFNQHAFMRTLQYGGEIDFDGLRRIGMPPEAVKTLSTAWMLSNKNLREWVANSPVYHALVLRRRNLPESVPELLHALQRHAISPHQLYQSIVDDLACVRPLDWPDGMLPGNAVISEGDY